MRMDFFSDAVEKQIEGSTATITGDGSKFEALVIAEAFAGKSTIQRHKMIYAVLNEHIASGAMHALTIKAHTPEEWAKKSAG